MTLGNGDTVAGVGMCKSLVLQLPGVTIVEDFLPLIRRYFGRSMVRKAGYCGNKLEGPDTEIHYGKAECDLKRGS